MTSPLENFANLLHIDTKGLDLDGIKSIWCGFFPIIWFRANYLDIANESIEDAFRLENLFLLSRILNMAYFINHCHKGGKKIHSSA